MLGIAWEEGAYYQYLLSVKILILPLILWGVKTRYIPSCVYYGNILI